MDIKPQNVYKSWERRHPWRLCGMPARMLAFPASYEWAIIQKLGD
jgi:hypothetical protein